MLAVTFEELLICVELPTLEPREASTIPRSSLGREQTSVTLQGHRRETNSTIIQNRTNNTCKSQRHGKHPTTRENKTHIPGRKCEDPCHQAWRRTCERINMASRHLHHVLLAACNVFTEARANITQVRDELKSQVGSQETCNLQARHVVSHFERS